MNWTELLNAEVAATFRATEGLLDLVDDDKLAWKPETGSNWMTTEQLLMHITGSCGACCKGFVTGDWGLPPDVKMEEMAPEDMLPPAEKMPAVESLARARELLAEDRATAFQMIGQAGEDDLAGKLVDAPWCPEVKMPLGQHLLQMVGHLALHKAQLFYYLKLQEKQVNTGHLWGM